jgi:hypothetical protein
MTMQTTCKECAFFGTWHYAGPLPTHGARGPDVIDLAEELKDRFSCQVCKNIEVAQQTGAKPSEGDEPLTDLATAWKTCRGSFFRKKATIKERLFELLDKDKPK